MSKTIEVSDEMYSFLMELSKELNIQDHRGTAMPYFFQIQTQEEVAVPEGCGTECFFMDDHKIETDKEIQEAIYDYYGGKFSKKQVREMDAWEQENTLKVIGFRKVYYDFKNKYENAFLTAKACKEHIRLNSYHYHKPVDYLTHAFRNPELEMVLKFVCELTGDKIHT